MLSVSNEQTFSPSSSKWIIYLFLVLALVQQLSVLVVHVKDAFLTVPQKDLVLVEIPNWAKTDEMRSNGIIFFGNYYVLVGSLKLA